MDKTAEFIVRHPGLLGVLCAALVGAAGFNAFRAGITYADLRAGVSDRAREASEALGG